MMHYPGEHYRTVHLPLPSERRQRRARILALTILWAVLICISIGLTLLTVALSPAWAGECDGLRLEVGIGVHDPGIDGPEYTTRNPLGIVAARYHMGPWAFSFEHTSSLEGFPAVFHSPHEYGYGANVLSVRYGWTL